jgi:thymidine kinase
MTTTTEGYLELFIGPMFSSKTSRLIDLYKKYTFCNINVVVINHTIDNRYDNELLSSHDKVMIPCIKSDNLKTPWEKMKNEKVDVILINEGQFFYDLYEIVSDMVHCGKKVYIGGLDGDFERKKFGQILDLIPLCDKVTKLSALCNICKNGKDAIFSLRLSNETNQTVVGSDNYIPVCRGCYERCKV